MKLKTIDPEIETIHVKYWSFVKCQMLAQLGVMLIVYSLLAIIGIILYFGGWL